MAKAIETLSIKLEFKDAGTQQIISKLKSSFKGLEQVISGNTKPAIQKLRNEINTFAATGNKSISTIESQVTALRALRREADINSREFKQLTADISKYEKQLAKAGGRRRGGGGAALKATQIGGAAISGGIFGGPEGFIGALGGAALGGVPGAFAGAAIGAQIGMIRQSLGGIAETVAEINSMKIALAGVSESAEDYRQSFNNVIEISKEFLFPVDKAIGEFTRLKAAVVGAGFGTKEATDVFKGFAAAILATGGNSEKLSGALLAASQVFSKGKVQAEELRGQIGERLPGAFTTFAQSIGVSSRDLDDMLRKGEVSTENFVEFTRTLFSRYEKTAETLGSAPEKAGQRLQLALSLATLEYGGFFQKVGAGFQDYLTNLVNFVTENKQNFIKIVANVAAFSQDIVDQIKNAAMNIATPFIVVFSALEVKIENLQEQFGLLFKAAEAFGKLLIRADGFDGFDLPPSGRPSVEERATAIRGQLEGLFSQFTPTSFGTSLGDKPLPGGDTGGDTGTGTKSTLARRVEQAQALENRMQRQLLLAQQQTQLGRILAQQDNERSVLQEKIAKLKQGETSAELERAAASAKNLLDQKLGLELQQKLKDLTEKATKPLEDALKAVKEKLATDKRYAELIKKGIAPERAKDIINIEKAKKETLKRLDVEIKILEAIVAQGGATKELTEALEKLRKEREKAEGVDGEKATEGDNYKKAKSDFEKFQETFKQGLKEMIDIGPQIANVALGAINSVTDGIVELITTGKANFKEMAVSILKDLAKIMIRAALVNAIAGAFGINLAAANGAVLQGGRVQKYANGGVVGGPTLFPMAGGQVGLMGEAGPEAIMPLKRGSDGKLGVTVNDSGMGASMSRYSPGKRSASGISGDDGGGGDYGGSMGGGTVVNYNGPTLNFNSEDYVPASAVPGIIDEAAKRGAKAGESRTFASLQNSRSRRSRIGLSS